MNNLKVNSTYHHHLHNLLHFLFDDSSQIVWILEDQHPHLCQFPLSSSILFSSSCHHQLHLVESIQQTIGHVNGYWLHYNLFCLLTYCWDSSSTTCCLFVMDSTEFVDHHHPYPCVVVIHHPCVNIICNHGYTSCYNPHLLPTSTFSLTVFIEPLVRWWSPYPSHLHIMLLSPFTWLLLLWIWQSSLIRWWSSLRNIQTVDSSMESVEHCWIHM